MQTILKISKITYMHTYLVYSEEISQYKKHFSLRPYKMEAKRCANPLLWEEYPIGSPVKSPPAFQRFADLKPKESHESLKNGNENEHYV